MKLAVEVAERTYPRKAPNYSVWIVDTDSECDGYIVKTGATVICVHQAIDKATADLVAAAFRTFLAAGGDQHILDAAAERA